MINAAFFLQLSLSALGSQAIYLLTYENTDSNLLCNGIFCIFGVLIYMINSLFLRKSRTVSNLVILNSVIAVLFAAGAIFIRKDFTFGPIFLTIILTIALTVGAVSFCIKDPNMLLPLLSLDGSVIFMIIFSVMAAFAGSSGMLWIIPSAVSTASGLISIILSRIERRPNAREIGLITGILIIIFAIAGLFVAFAAAPAGTGLVEFARLVAIGARYIWKIICKFFAWLSSFADPGAAGAIASGGAASSEQTPEEEYTDTTLGIIIFIILIAAAAAAFVFLLIKLRKFKIKKLSATAGAKLSVRTSERPPLKNALKELIFRLKKKARINRYLRSHKDTALGIYYKTEKKYSHRKYKKLPGETPSGYISRLETAVSESDKASYAETAAPVFSALRNAINASMYGGKDDEIFEYREELRKMLKVL